MREPNMGAIGNKTGLNLFEVRALLEQQGYGLTCRYSHVHATQGREEWHLCLVGELATMRPSDVLASLDEALTYSIQRT